MEIVFLGLLLAVIYPASLGLENKYIPPSLPQYSLQSLEDYSDTPSHTLDQDGYRYRVGRLVRHRREALDAATPATFDDLYADSRSITQNLPDSNFLGPSPDEISVPESNYSKDDEFQGPSPDEIARPSAGAPTLSVLQPFQQAFIESAVLANDGYHYKTVVRRRTTTT